MLQVAIKLGVIQLASPALVSFGSREAWKAHGGQMSVETSIRLSACSRSVDKTDLVADLQIKWWKPQSHVLDAWAATLLFLLNKCQSSHHLIHSLLAWTGIGRYYPGEIFICSTPGGKYPHMDNIYSSGTSLCWHRFHIFAFNFYLLFSFTLLHWWMPDDEPNSCKFKTNKRALS